MTELSVESFTHTLINDVNLASQRLQREDTPAHRRELIRAIFAAIEGLQWQLKQDVLTHPGIPLSHLEYAAMTEETYSVDDRGEVNVSARFLPITTAIRLVAKMVRRYRPQFDCDFSHVGWANLKKAVEVRNRLVHPKRIEDLKVSDDELAMAQSALGWFLAMVILALRASLTDMHLKIQNDRSSDMHDE